MYDTTALTGFDALFCLNCFCLFLIMPTGMGILQTHILKGNSFDLYRFLGVSQRDIIR